MYKDPRPYCDPIVGRTMLPVYWKDGMPTFVPPHLHEKAKEEAFRSMSLTNPGRMEVIT